MTTLFVPANRHAGETRAAMVPDAVSRLARLGASVQIEPGLGASIPIPDEAYLKAGATLAADRKAGLADADLVCYLRRPPAEDLPSLRKGAALVGYLDPFRDRELIEACAQAGITALSVELIPRTTLAQKMDALSSQASLAGYVAVMLAANRLPQAFPMMMTPAGTLQPARVFIVGAGVAGLQAIATAKRLGARVEAYDTRPVVEEQVTSLGARFIKLDIGETGQTEQGYARELTPEQLERQRQEMAKVVARADVVITTAQVFGRPAPRILTDDMVRGMQPGSVIVDMAVETGGNVEGSVAGEEVERHGVILLGLANLPGRVARHASQMYASNLAHLVEHFWNPETKSFELRAEDEIAQGCTVTRDGEIVHPVVKERLTPSGA